MSEDNAEVYEVQVDGKRRVLKLMPEEARARAEREVAVGQTFDHPNLSRVLDDELREVEVAGDTLVFFTEEFVEGETLAARTTPMEPSEALDLARR